jgi:hypothetical protein
VRNQCQPILNKAKNVASAQRKNFTTEAQRARSFFGVREDTLSGLCGEIFILRDLVASKGPTLADLGAYAKDDGDWVLVSS